VDSDLDWMRHVFAGGGGSTAANDNFDEAKKVVDFFEKPKSKKSWVGIDYGYDASHRMVANGATDSRIMGALPTAGTYGAANALNQVANVPNRTPLTWSDAGNMQSDGRGNTFTHDGNNRLTKATKASGDILNFRYDGDGLRMESIKNSTGTTPNLQFAGGVHTRYVTSATEVRQDTGRSLGDFDPCRIADLDGNRAVLRRYVAGPAIDERIAQVDANGAVTYIHTDKQNSVVALTNATGNPISRRGYGEYGQTNPTQMAETTHPFGYTGRRYEAELGLYYYRARWYDPELGTFLETDPIGSLDYVNLYSYVGLDPMGKTDPSGMVCQTAGTPPVTTCTADTYDPARSNGQTTEATPEMKAAAEAGKSAVAVASGNTEKVGFGVRQTNGTLQVQASVSATTATTATGATASAGVPNNAEFVIHGHIDGGPNASDGMVDNPNRAEGTPLGDAQPLSLANPMPNATVSNGQVGWHEIRNGQLAFTAPASSMTPAQQRQIQRNLNAEQRYFRR
ncbi:MAG: RHS repeat-associated core domain-containing protein, partial [Pseudomonadota bacterium]